LLFALVMVLVTAIIILQVQLKTQSQLQQSAFLFSKVRLQSSILSNAQLLLQRLADDDNLLVDHPSEAWAKPEDISDPTGISLKLSIHDAQQYFDLNNVYVSRPNLTTRKNAEILVDLFNMTGDFSPSEKIQSLLDWIDPDDEGFRESFFYEKKDPGYSCPNTWLSSMGELLWVNGFSPSYFERQKTLQAAETFNHSFEETFTIFPVKRNQAIKVNINSAPKHVLQSILGQSQEAFVDAVIAWRRDTPIQSLEKFNFQMSPSLLQDLNHYVDVKSSFFTLKATAYEAGHRVEVLALLHRSSQGDVEVIQWQM